MFQDIVSHIGPFDRGALTDKQKKQEDDMFLALIQKTQNGDSDAFEQIYDIFINDVYRYLAVKMDVSEIQDVASEIFFKVWTKIGTFSGETRGQFKAWLFTIAHNSIVDFYRARKENISLDNLLELPDTNSDMDPEDTTFKHMSVEKLLEALKELPKGYENILTLRFLQDFSNQEIAEILQMKEGNVRILVHRAIKKLREIVERSE